MNQNEIPQDLKTLIGSEDIDFVVKSSPKYSKRNGVILFIVALFLIKVVYSSVATFLIPILKKEKIPMKIDGVSTYISLENWEVLVAPLFPLILLFLLVVGIFIQKLVKFFPKGGYFVGTKTRLIKYRKGEIIVKEWDQFSGNITIKNELETGDLILELREGQIIQKREVITKYVPEVISMRGIKNVLKIEKLCRLRIKENDPTPSK